MDIILVVTIAVLLVIIVIVSDFWLNDEGEKEIFYKSLKKIITFLTFLVVIIILISMFVILGWIGFNMRNLGFNFNINQSDAIRIVLNIFQLLIISLGIFIGYFNYKELIRKNQGDHFPEIKINKEGVKTIDGDSKGEYRKGMIIQNFIIENISNHFIKIGLRNVLIDGIKSNGHFVFDKKLDTSKYIGDVQMWSDNNLISKGESIEIEIEIKKSGLDRLCNKTKIEKIRYLNIVLALECHKVTKYVELSFYNENIFSKNKNTNSAYKFYGFKYL